jgi:hypothetical protein
MPLDHGLKACASARRALADTVEKRTTDDLAPSLRRLCWVRPPIRGARMVAYKASALNTAYGLTVSLLKSNGVCDSLAVTWGLDEQTDHKANQLP